MSSSPDVTTLAILKGAFRSITNEMSHVVLRTARTPVFKLAKDFSCTLCDWEARQIVQGESELPVQVGSIQFICKAVADAYAGDVQPGDLFLCNDPEFGGIHLNDVGLLRPIFYRDELLFWAVTRGHWLDIGGPVPADLVKAQSDSHGEGVRMPPTRVHRAGEPVADMMRLIFANIRFPERQKSDMLALTAATDIAAKRLLALVEKYGVGTVKSGIETLYDMTDRRVRAAIAELPDGTAGGSAWMSAREGNDHIELKAEVTIDGDELYVSLDSPPQLRDVRNSPFGATHAAAVHAIAVGLGIAPPFDAGLSRALHIDYGPVGTVMNAKVPPAATLGCTTQPFCEIIDCVRAAMSQLIPAERQTAGWGAPGAIVLSGIHPDTDEFYAHFHPNAGTVAGSGAAYGYDGWSGVGSENSSGAIQKESIELLEYEMPFHIRHMEYRTDSGGAGRWRGGLGLNCEWVPRDHRQTSRYHATIDTFPALGVGGAHSTLTSRKLGERLVYSAAGTASRAGGASRPHAERGGWFEFHAPGGGGVGDPFERDPERVAQDVRNGLVSVEGARAEYGVVFDPGADRVDTMATGKLRHR